MSSFFKSSGSVDNQNAPQLSGSTSSNTENTNAVSSFFKTSGANSTDEATIQSSVTAAAASATAASTSATAAASSASTAASSATAAAASAAQATAAANAGARLGTKTTPTSAPSNGDLLKFSTASDAWVYSQELDAGTY